MDKEAQLAQGDIDVVWSHEWRQQYSAKQVFGHRLFIEGYPIFRKFIPNTAKRILDVGSGTGRYGVKFAQDLPDSTVYVTDITDESLQIARMLATEVGVHNVITQKEDVTALSVEDNFFDVVFCDVVIQHLPNPEQAVEEMSRVLKPGGTLIYSTMNVWNFHSLYKFALRIAGKPYYYGYEKSYTKKGLRDLLDSRVMRVLAEDGFYPAYGIFRLRNISPFYGMVGKILNRLNRIIDPLTGRICSKYLGFEIVVVAQKLPK